MDRDLVLMLFDGLDGGLLNFGWKFNDLVVLLYKGVP